MIPIGNYRVLLRELGRQGWTVLKTANNHYRATPPGEGGLVLFSSSREPRAWWNTVARLKKSGFRG